MAGAAGGASFSETESYTVAFIFFTFLLFTYGFEAFVHKVQHALHKNAGLVKAVTKMKDELMLLGVFSLLISALEEYILEICVDDEYDHVPCPPDEASGYDDSYGKSYDEGYGDSYHGDDDHSADAYPAYGSPEDDHSPDYGSPTYASPTYAAAYEEDHSEAPHRHLLAAAAAATCPDGKKPIISLLALHQTHIFVFILAMCHISLATVAIVMSQVRINMWKKWESEVAHWVSLARGGSESAAVYPSMHQLAQVLKSVSGNSATSAFDVDSPWSDNQHAMLESKSSLRKYILNPIARAWKFFARALPKTKSHSSATGASAEPISSDPTPTSDGLAAAKLGNMFSKVIKQHKEGPSDAAAAASGSSTSVHVPTGPSSPSNWGELSPIASSTGNSSGGSRLGSASFAASPGAASPVAASSGSASPSGRSNSLDDAKRPCPAKPSRLPLGLVEPTNVVMQPESPAEAAARASQDGLALEVSEVSLSEVSYRASSERHMQVAESCGSFPGLYYMRAERRQALKQLEAISGRESFDLNSPTPTSTMQSNPPDSTPGTTPVQSPRSSFIGQDNVLRMKRVMARVAQMQRVVKHMRQNHRQKQMVSNWRRSKSLLKYTEKHSKSLPKATGFREDSAGQGPEPVAGLADSLQMQMEYILSDFARQFYSPIVKEEFGIIQVAFIRKHRPGQKFEFLEYVRHAMQDTYESVVGIDISMWALVIALLLLEGFVTGISWFITFVGACITIAIGMKLEKVLRQVCVGVVRDRDREEGEFLTDDNFWFKNPRFLLRLIRFVVFQNAYQLTRMIFWDWQEDEHVKSSQCNVKILEPYTEHYKAIETAVQLFTFLAVVVHSSYTLLPLYTLVEQMGSQYNAAIFSDQVAKALKRLASKVRLQAEQSGHRSASGTRSKMKAILNKVRWKNRFTEDMAATIIQRTWSKRFATTPSKRNLVNILEESHARAKSTPVESTGTVDSGGKVELPGGT